VKLRHITTVFLVIIIAAVYVFGSRLSDVVENQDQYFVFGGKVLNIELADDVLSRTRGLSGRESLSGGSGLLFVFAELGQPGFWMKDMNFPIDILWFNEGRELIDVTEDVYPETFPETFYSNAPVKYVLEVNIDEFLEPEKFIGQTFELSTEKSDE
jgi:uncharacterized membrane protein (UPF0127 family)